jgi:DsbC/DsbD-like thiol-disulfide interchange protein
VWVGLQLTHAPDWHTYWKNPATRACPPNCSGPLPGRDSRRDRLAHAAQVPARHLANYGYDGTVLLPVPLQVSPEFKGTHLDVALYATWLVCRKECIPKRATFSLRIPAQGSTGGTAPRSKPPLPPRRKPAGAGQRAEARGLRCRWPVGPAGRLAGQTLEFFPEMPRA